MFVKNKIFLIFGNYVLLFRLSNHSNGFSSKQRRGFTALVLLFIPLTTSFFIFLFVSSLFNFSMTSSSFLSVFPLLLFSFLFFFPSFSTLISLLSFPLSFLTSPASFSSSKHPGSKTIYKISKLKFLSDIDLSHFSSLLVLFLTFQLT